MLQYLVQQQQKKMVNFYKIKKFAKNSIRKISSFPIYSFLHEFHTITENGQRFLWGARFCKCWLKNALSHKACASVLQSLKDCNVPKMSSKTSIHTCLVESIGCLSFRTKIWAQEKTIRKKFHFTFFLNVLPDGRLL